MDESQVAALIAQLKEASSANSSGYNVLDLSGCCLSSASVAEILGVVENAPSITELHLQNNHLGPEGVVRLCGLLKKSKQLRVLDLRYTHLTFADLSKLSVALENNFTIVDFKIDEPAGEGVRDVPYSLRLDVPASLSQVGELKWSVFTRKEFDNVRDRIQDITAVNRKVYECVTNKRDELSLYNRHITRLPEVIMMGHLRILDLRNNALTQLPLSLEDLQSLEQLFLDGNRLSSLPHSIGSLQRLLILSLRKNNLAQLPGSMPLLVNLQQLFISDNSIKEVPLMLGSLRGLKKMDATGNPFTSKIPSSVTDMLEYIREQYKHSDSKKNLRMKLAIVGGQQVGKTSFVRFLKSRLSASSKMKSTPTQPRRTSTNRANSPAQPIDADTIEVDEFEVNHPSIPNNEHLLFITYDFGGEEYYQATHQFFLSPQSMYLLVFDLLRPEEEFSQVSFWLHLINERAPDCPVILIGTHCDDKRCNRVYIESTMRGIFERVKTWDRFPLAYWFTVDSVTGTNMKEFLKLLVEITLQQPNVNVKTPESFLQLESKVMAIKETKPLPPIMPRITLNKLAKEANVPDMDVVAALEHLFSIGVAVYFNDQINKLDGTVVLGRRWLVDFWVPVMKLRYSEALQRPAVVKPADITALWKAPKYPPDVHQFFLGLLMKFELALPLENGNLFIPYMLPTSPPDSFREVWPEDPHAAEQRRYFAIDGRLPQHVFSRLLCRLIQGVTNWDIISYWRTGILLKQGTQAIVAIQLDVHLSLLKLRVRGPQQVIKLIELDEVIENLFQDWLNLDVVVKIPCRHCLQDGHDQDAYLFAREDLEEAVSRTNPFVNCMRENRPKPVRVEWLVPDIAMTSFSGEKVEFKDLELRKQIGEGAYATVYEGRWRNQQVAVKQLNISSIVSGPGQNVFAEFRREVWLMSGLQNDNLVVLKAITMEPFCMILEYMERGSLYHFLKDPSNPVDWELRVLFAQDVAHAMDFLHSLVPPIVHRDLKSPNILLTHDESEGRLKAKVSDFGLSRSLTLRGEFDSKTLQRNNPVWLAPEILEGKDYNEKADVYSYGVILWELLARSDFFGEKAWMNDIVLAVVSGERPAIPTVEGDPFGVFEDYAALIRACWDKDPAARPSFSEICAKLDEIHKKLPERPKPKKVSSKTSNSVTNEKSEATSPRGGSQVASGDVASDVEVMDSSDNDDEDLDSDPMWRSGGSGTDLDSMASSADEGSARRRVIRPSLAAEKRPSNRYGKKGGREVRIAMALIQPADSSATGLAGMVSPQRGSQRRLAARRTEDDSAVDFWQMLSEEPPVEFHRPRSLSSGPDDKSVKSKDDKKKISSKSSSKNATSSSGGTSERSDFDEEEVDFLEALKSLDPKESKAKKQKEREEAEDRAIVAVLRRLLKPKSKKKSPKPSAPTSESEGKGQSVTSDEDNEDMDILDALRSIKPPKSSKPAKSNKKVLTANSDTEGTTADERDDELDLSAVLRALPTTTLAVPVRRTSIAPARRPTAGTSSDNTSASDADADGDDAIDFMTALRSLPSSNSNASREQRRAEDRAVLDALKRYTHDYSRGEEDSPKPALASSPPTVPKPVPSKRDSEQVDFLSFLREEPAGAPEPGAKGANNRPVNENKKGGNRWGTLKKLLARGGVKAQKSSPTQSAPSSASSQPVEPIEEEEDDEEVDFFQALRAGPPPAAAAPKAKAKPAQPASKSPPTFTSSKKSGNASSDGESAVSPRVVTSAIPIMSDDEGEEVDFFTAIRTTDPAVDPKNAKKEKKSNKPKFGKDKDAERAALLSVFRGLVQNKIDRQIRRESRRNMGIMTGTDNESDDEPMDFFEALKSLERPAPGSSSSSSSKPSKTTEALVSPRGRTVSPPIPANTRHPRSMESSPKNPQNSNSSFDTTDDDELDQSMDFFEALRAGPTRLGTGGLPPNGSAVRHRKPGNKDSDDE